jgi:hypothetical protein
MRPTLMGREWVRIAPIDRSGTQVDALGEPVRRIARDASVEIQGQVNEQVRNGRQPDAAGPELPLVAEIALRASDVAASGWTPADGDRVTGVKGIARGATWTDTVGWYVVRVRRSGKLGLGAAASRDLVILDVADRPGRRAAESL